jgi:hypothetical protein
MRNLIVPLVAAACLTAACSSTSPTFTLNGAAVDPTYFCPGGANDAAYDLHATISAHNGTSKAVTIESVTAQMTLTTVKGDWLEKAGSHYDAGSAHFTPLAVAPGSTTTLKVTIPSACTSNKYGGSSSSYGDYQVSMKVTTSAGAFTVTAANLHEIIAA